MIRLAVAVTLWALATAPGAGAETYLAELQRRAREEALARDPGWARLLHLRSSWGGVASTIDFPGFFLAPAGRRDPQAELDATLAAFFDPQPLYGEPRQCRFKARYEWLRERLGWDPQRLPAQPCERFEAWRAALDTGALTLVFASNDLNSPSSMFGHTLLRLDARAAGGDVRLLAYAVNYAAQTGPEAGFFYALKGLSGFYQAYYSVLPYYEKVREYERFEHRDLWEYPLQLDADARERLLRHLWELRGVGSDYYFFTENCSYQLLALLEAAVPGLAPTRDFAGPVPYAIPIDTVRSLARAGVLGTPSYRASAATRMQHEFGQLDPQARDWVLRYARGDARLDEPALRDRSAAGQAGMLQLAHDTLHLDVQQRERDRASGLARARDLLIARAANPAPSPFSAVPAPADAPDRGHRSTRWSLGLRLPEAGSGRVLLGVRPAYHDRLDPPAGYLRGGEIEFLSLELSVSRTGARLDQLRALSIEALAPRDDLFAPTAWFAAAGLRRPRPVAGTPGSLGAWVDGGFGLAWAPRPAARLYAFAMLAAENNRDLPRGHEWAAGARAGALVQGPGPVSAELDLQVLDGVGGLADEWVRLRSSVQLHAGVGAGLRLAWIRQRRGGIHDHGVELRWFAYR